MTRAGDALRATGRRPPAPTGSVLLAGLAVGVAAVLTACTVGPVEGLQGRFVAVDDTGLRDSPVEDGWILALPGAEPADLGTGDDVSEQPSGPGDLRVAVDPDEVERAGGDLAPVRGGGRFTLDVPAGPALVCRVTGSAARLRTQGCVVFDLPDDGRLRATTGEGPFTLELAD